MTDGLTAVELGVLYFTKHICCSIFMVKGPKATFHLYSLLDSVLLVIDLVNKLIWTWLGPVIFFLLMVNFLVESNDFLR